jgi:molecular chaperone HscB
MQNHFDLFHLPQSFVLDLSALERAYHEVQNQVHPDKFVNAGDAQKRVAMQWATRANEAYQVLKNPLRRARYLCELNGVDLQTESNTAMPHAFLMQQMEWREALEEARSENDINVLENLETELRAAHKAEVLNIGEQLDKNDFPQAAQWIRQLMFLEKLAEETERALQNAE